MECIRAGVFKPVAVRDVNDLVWVILTVTVKSFGGKTLHTDGGATFVDGFFVSK